MKIDIKGTIVPSADAEVYDWFGIPNVSPAKVADALERAGGEDIDIDINSGGGEVFAGSEIYSAIRAYRGNVRIHVVGLAASAASVIACAGKSDISPTAQMMIHNVSTVSVGDVHDMEHSAEMLKQANRAIAGAYTAKSGMSEQDALDLMDVETWITAQDAVEYGLIDSIAESQNSNAEPKASAAKQDASVQLAASVGGCGLLPLSVIDSTKKLLNERAEKCRQLSAYFSS